MPSASNVVRAVEEADTLSGSDQRELIAELFDSLETVHESTGHGQQPNRETSPHIKTKPTNVGPQGQHQTSDTVKNHSRSGHRSNHQ